jgi:integrase
MLHGNVRRRGLEDGAAKLNRAGEVKLTMHDLRHCFASMLIREGADVVFVSRQLGHANPAITLIIYAHLFDSETQATMMRDALQARFGGNSVVTSDREGAGDTGMVAAENVVSMRP